MILLLATTLVCQTPNTVPAPKDFSSLVERDWIFMTTYPGRGVSSRSYLFSLRPGGKRAEGTAWIIHTYFSDKHDTYNMSRRKLEYLPAIGVAWKGRYAFTREKPDSDVIYLRLTMERKFERLDKGLREWKLVGYNPRGFIVELHLDGGAVPANDVQMVVLGAFRPGEQGREIPDMSNNPLDFLVSGDTMKINVLDQEKHPIYDSFFPPGFKLRSSK